jgi:hypothetical protein
MRSGNFRNGICQTRSDHFSRQSRGMIDLQMILRINSLKGTNVFLLSDIIRSPFTLSYSGFKSETEKNICNGNVAVCPLNLLALGQLNESRAESRLNPSGHIVVLGSTQPLTEMSTRNPSWG